MTAFHAPLDDILFSLRHVARADRLPDWDDELAAEIIGHFASFAEGRIAPLDAPGDAEGCRLENGRVRMPAGFRELYAELAGQGWQGLSIPEAFGGQALSAAIRAGVLACLSRSWSAASGGSPAARSSSSAAIWEGPSEDGCGRSRIA